MALVGGSIPPPPRAWDVPNADPGGDGGYIRGRLKSAPPQPAAAAECRWRGRMPLCDYRTPTHLRERRALSASPAMMTTRRHVATSNNASGKAGMQDPSRMQLHLNSRWMAIPHTGAAVAFASGGLWFHAKDGSSPCGAVSRRSPAALLHFSKFILNHWPPAGRFGTDTAIYKCIRA